MDSKIGWILPHPFSICEQVRIFFHREHQELSFSLGMLPSREDREEASGKEILISESLFSANLIFCSLQTFILVLLLEKLVFNFIPFLQLLAAMVCCPLLLLNLILFVILFLNCFRFGNHYFIFCFDQFQYWLLLLSEAAVEATLYRWWNFSKHLSIWIYGHYSYLLFWLV